MNKKKIFFLIFILIIFFNFYFLQNYFFDKEKIQYSQLNKKYISISILEKFKNIKTLKEFEEIGNKFGYNNVMILILKFKNINLWKKFWLLKYDYYVNKKDKYFLEDIKTFGKNPKEGYIKILDSKFLEIQKGIIKLSESDLDMDINVYFNDLKLQKALSNCNYLRDSFSEKYKGDNYSCEDKIYFYRATRQNKYCDKIIDSYKKKLCKDFLNYQKINK